MITYTTKILSVYRNTDNAVILIEFERTYSSTEMPGITSVAGGKVYPVAPFVSSDTADFIAAVDLALAAEDEYNNLFHQEMLEFQFKEANAVREEIEVTSPVEVLRPLTAREVRLTLIHFNIPLSVVDGYIAALPAGAERDSAQTEWEYATTFTRDHYMIAALATQLDLSAETVDDMWRYGMALEYTKAPEITE